MGKYKGNSNNQKKVDYPYPSQHGSHLSMVNSEETKRISDENLVVCKDEFGIYITERKSLDNGMADPYRDAPTDWRSNYLQKTLGEVIEIVL